jgi:PAS domain S-box-containing protein
MTQRDKDSLKWEPLSPGAGYGLAVVATLLSALLRWLLPSALSPAPYLGFYPAVVVSAALGGIGPGLVASFSSLLLVNLVFGRFDLQDHGAMLRQLIWITASIGVSVLAGRLRTARARAEAESARARTAETDLRNQAADDKLLILKSDRDIAERKRAEARLRRFYETDLFAVLYWQLDGGVVNVNDQFLRMTAYTREDLDAGLINWSKLTPPEFHDMDEDARRQILETGIHRPYEKQFIRKDGHRVWGLFSAAAYEDDPTCGVSFILDITERKRIENEIAAHRDLLETVFEHMPAAINIIRGRDLRLVMVNAGYRAIAPGKTEFVGKTLDELWPETGQDFAALCRRVLETGEPHHVVDELNLIRRHPDGPAEKAWFTWSLCRIRLPSDEGWGIFNPAWETTARKQAEEMITASLREKEVMLKEIHHRVKNNLQVIASLVDLQAGNLKEPSLLDAFADIRNRVRSMALVHEKLYQSESLAHVDFADYMRSLLSYLASSHAKPGTNIRLKSELQPVQLSVEKAVPCGLMVNELVSNAFKHAFRGRAEGEVSAELRADPDGRVWVRIGDNGVGLPPGLDWRQSGSLGLRLIQLLAGQLNASVEVRSVNGTEFQFAFQPETTEAAD